MNFQIKSGEKVELIYKENKITINNYYLEFFIETYKKYVL